LRKILLSFYSVSFAPAHKPKQPFTLGEIDDTGLSAASILFRYFTAKTGQLIHHPKHGRTLTIAEAKQERGGEIIYGKTEGGEYGFTSSAMNIATGKLAWKRSVNDSEAIPLYFCLSLPASQDRGIMVLQKFGQTGVKDPLVTDMKEYLTAAYPDIRFHVKALSLGDVLAEYLEHAVCSELTLISSKIPKDKAERISWTRQAMEGKTAKNGETKGTLETIIRANRFWRIGGLKNRIKKIRSGEMQVNQLVELDGVEYDEAAVTLERGGHKKKFHLSKTEFARTFIDVSDDCKRNGGHPVPADIHREALKLIDGISHIV
jgi:hypothetical protein